jgi:predicted 3-demethylubiquinone-9 3-methyltransferase (glyoxalase superfamily)
VASIKQRIVPHLWYDRAAREAAGFYASVFPDSKIANVALLHDTPSGDCEVVSFDLCGQPFMAISAGPHFKPNPSISFFVNFDPSRRGDARQALDTLWETLSEGGKALMPLDRYPFSERYGWVEDRYGVSWQLILTDPEGEPRPDIVPSLMFVGGLCGKAEEATAFYLSVFGNTRRGQLVRYPEGMLPDKAGTVMFTDFMLEGQWFAAMDSAQAHAFAFNEAISLIVYCDTQEEIDRYWERLSAVPKAEQCGWLKDRYGVSWQIVPRALDGMISKGTPQQIAQVTQAFLKMKKFDLAALQRAYDAE